MRTDPSPGQISGEYDAAIPATAGPCWTLTAVPYGIDRAVVVRVHDRSRTQDWPVGSIDEFIVVQEKPASGPVELLDDKTGAILAAVGLPDGRDIVLTFGARPATDSTSGWWMAAKQWHVPEARSDVGLSGC